ncbi:MAG: antibiotic biosynthesis monooxygenase [Gammaproteobacteria bacterium]|jgi:heme-degrading monooxygenase HmoA
MYVVIFTAKLKQLDECYYEMAAKLKEVAFDQYNCIKFTSCTEGNLEISASYWHSLEDIKSWKQHADHLQAQEKGKREWYESYEVQVSEVLREYQYSD